MGLAAPLALASTRNVSREPAKKSKARANRVNLNKGTFECREKRDFTLWPYGGKRWGCSAPHLKSE